MTRHIRVCVMLIVQRTWNMRGCIGVCVRTLTHNSLLFVEVDELNSCHALKFIHCRVK